MKRSLLPLVSTLVVAISSVAVAFSDANDAIPAPAIDAVFAEWDTPQSPGCAVGVYHNGEMAYQRGYGMANLEHGVANTPRTVFRIASTSKQFTAFAILLLAGDGKLGLDDDVRLHVPELPIYERPVTLRQLVHHTSGLRDYLELMRLRGLGADDFYHHDDVIALITRQQGLNFPPGDDLLYSNSGYVLLAEVIKRVSGQTLAEFTAAHIFEPLGMTQSHFHDDHNHLIQGRAQGYSQRWVRGPEGVREPSGGLRINQTTLDVVGDGGVFTTIGDLLKWDRNFYDAKVGGADLVAQATAPGSMTGGQALLYAFGLSVRQRKGLTMISHAGTYVGYRAELIRFPARRLSVAVLCNFSKINPTRLAEQVADIILEGPGQMVTDQVSPQAGGGQEAAAMASVSAERLASFAGTYKSLTSGSAYRVEVAGGSLTLTALAGFRPGRRHELDARGANHFATDFFGTRWDFRFEDQGGAKRMIATREGRNREYPFTAVTGTPPSGDALAQFTGSFASAELGVTYHIGLEDGALMVRIEGRKSWLFPRKLTPLDAVTLSGGYFRLDMERDGAGQVSGFSLTSRLTRGLRFERF